MIRAVLFDVYGTIAGWSPSRYQLQRMACAAFGLGDAVTPEGILKGYAAADAYMTAENASLGRCDSATRRGRDEFFGEYERLVLKGCGIDVEADLAMQIFNRLSDAPSALTPFDDVVPTLVELRERGLTLGLISNMNMGGADLLRDLGLSSHVDFAAHFGRNGNRETPPSRLPNCPQQGPGGGQRGSDGRRPAEIRYRGGGPRWNRTYPHRPGRQLSAI